jgi:hypothetical protein
MKINALAAGERKRVLFFYISTALHYSRGFYVFFDVVKVEHFCDVIN